MAPIRRYLRITKHSVLEVRIYLVRMTCFSHKEGPR